MAMSLAWEGGKVVTSSHLGCWFPRRKAAAKPETLGLKSFGICAGNVKSLGSTGHPEILRTAMSSPASSPHPAPTPCSIQKW